MRRFTKEEDSYIIDNYSNTNTGLIANYLGRSISSVKSRASFLGIKKAYSISKDVKTCRECGVSKDAQHFGIREKTSPSGSVTIYYRSKCRECEAALARKDPNKAERDRLWRAKNTELVKQYDKLSKLKRKDQIKAYNKQKYWSNPEYHRERAKEYAKNKTQEQREKDAARLRKRYWANLDKYRKMNREAYARHPEAAKAAATRRRARKKNAITTLTNKEWQDVLTTHNHSCVYCGSTDKITMDHVVPLAKGGSHTKENVVPACLSCNCSKGDKLLTEWSQSNKWLEQQYKISALIS